jgi:CHASE3 domain sensor protein
VRVGGGLVSVPNGINQRILTLEKEMERQRKRSHEATAKLIEQKGQIEAAREDLIEARTEIKDLRDEMNDRFDRISAQFWRGLMALLGVMTVAATIIGIIANQP